MSYFNQHLLLASILLFSCPTCGQQKPVKPADYTRIVLPASGKGHMDTAIVTFKDQQGRTLDLIGAVHLGEPSYYQALNLLFTKYDALLYELIANPDKRPGKKKPTPKPNGKKKTNDPVPPRKKRSIASSPLSMIQNFMGTKLGLAFQLKAIDYTKKNFVHADLTPGEFARKWAEKGGFLKIFLRAMALQDELNSASQTKDQWQLIFALLGKKPDYLRYLFARQMSQMDLLTKVIDGNDGVIITARNIAAIKAMKKQLQLGKKRIGLFYGAGHMADLEIRLLKNHGFKKVKTHWLKAWSFQLTKKQMKQSR